MKKYFSQFISLNSSVIYGFRTVRRISFRRKCCRNEWLAIDYPWAQGVKDHDLLYTSCLPLINGYPIRGWRDKIELIIDFDKYIIRLILNRWIGHNPWHMHSGYEILNNFLVVCDNRLLYAGFHSSCNSHKIKDKISK